MSSHQHQPVASDLAATAGTVAPPEVHVKYSMTHNQSEFRRSTSSSTSAPTSPSPNSWAGWLWFLRCSRRSRSRSGSGSRSFFSPNDDRKTISGLLLERSILITLPPSRERQAILRHPALAERARLHLPSYERQDLSKNM